MLLIRIGLYSKIYEDFKGPSQGSSGGGAAPSSASTASRVASTRSRGASMSISRGSTASLQKHRSAPGTGSGASARRSGVSFLAMSCYGLSYLLFYSLVSLSVSRHVTSRHVMSLVIPFRIMSCCAMSCHAISSLFSSLLGFVM